MDILIKNSFSNVQLSFDLIQSTVNFVVFTETMWAVVVENRKSLLILCLQYLHIFWENLVTFCIIWWSLSGMVCSCHHGWRCCHYHHLQAKLLTTLVSEKIFWNFVKNLVCVYIIKHFNKILKSLLNYV